MIRTTTQLHAPSDRQAHAFTLDLARAGQTVELINVEGKSLGHRLAELGLVPGSSFTIMAKGKPGPAIIAFGSSRMVLGRGMVHRVLVRSH